MTPSQIKARMDQRRAERAKTLHVEPAAVDEPESKLPHYRKYFAAHIAKMKNADARLTFKVLCQIADNHLEIFNEQAKLNGELSDRIVALEQALAAR
jgi:hypothetical protein